VPARVSVREPAEFDQLGLGRFERKAELAEPFAQSFLEAQCIAKLRRLSECCLEILQIFNHGFA
jgi:hypothetical protein